jgi:aminomethyltransferase
MIADLRYHVRSDRVLLDLPPERGPAVRETLDRHVVADDVTIEEATVGVLGLHGPRAPEVLARAAGREAPDAPRRGTDLEIAGAPVVAAGSRDLAERGYDLLAPRDAGDAVLAALVDAGATPFGPEAWESLRIEAGTPRWGPDVDEATIPNDAVEAAAISWTKGCYPGQEIVVRIRSRGFPARLLLGMEIDGDRPPPEGAEIRHSGVKAGRITSAVLGPSAGRVVALGYVTRRFYDLVEGFSVILPDGSEPAARIVPVPFAGGAREEPAS